MKRVKLVYPNTILKDGKSKEFAVFEIECKSLKPRDGKTAPAIHTKRENVERMVSAMLYWNMHHVNGGWYNAEPTLDDGTKVDGFISGGEFVNARPCDLIENYTRYTRCIEFVDADPRKAGEPEKAEEPEEIEGRASDDAERVPDDTFDDGEATTNGPLAKLKAKQKAKAAKKAQKKPSEAQGDDQGDNPNTVGETSENA